MGSLEDLPGGMDDRNELWEREKSMLAAWHDGDGDDDDDDDDTHTHTHTQNDFSIT